MNVSLDNMIVAAYVCIYIYIYILYIYIYTDKTRGEYSHK